MASPRFGCKDGFMLAGRMRDRRIEARRRTARLVQVAHDGEAAYARCRDFSDTGMKLDLTEPLELNDYVTIALSPSIVLCGSVSWVEGRECGIIFDCPVDSEALLEAIEPMQRAPDALATLDLLGNRHAPLRGKSLQSDSARRSGVGFQPGLAVTVMVGHNQEERGVLRWAKDDEPALELEPVGADARPGQGLLPGPRRR